MPVGISLALAVIPILIAIYAVRVSLRAQKYARASRIDAGAGEEEEARTGKPRRMVGKI